MRRGLSNWVLLSAIIIAPPAPAGGIQEKISSPGKAQINLGAGDWNAQQFINLFNSTTQYGFSGGATPAAVDNDGYPVRNFKGLIGGGLGFLGKTLSTTGPWILSWPAGRSSFKLILFAGATLRNAVNATFTNGAGRGNPTITGDGVHAGSVTINFNDTAGVIFKFDGSYAGNYANNTGGVMSLVRSSDVAAFNAGEFWTPEYIAIIKNLHPRSIRPMAWNLPRNANVDSNMTYWAYRKQTTSLSFIESNNNFPPGTRSGGATSFATISYNSSTGVFTAAAAADTPLAGWVNGETLTGNNGSTVSGIAITNAVAKTGTNAGKVQLTVANTTGFVVGNPVQIAGNNNNGLGTIEADGSHTILSVDSSTTFTIDVTFVHTFDITKAPTVSFYTLAITGKSGGAKLILNNYAQPIGYGSANDQVSILSGNATYVYDSVLDAVIYTSDGVSSHVPIEAQVQLAVRVNANLWYNIPTWAVDDYITNVANTAFSSFASLGSNLKFQVEYSNELWNNFQIALHLIRERGLALGLPGGNLDYQALRLRQIHGNILPATSWGGAMSRLERLYMFQGGTGLGDTSITFYMSGKDLAPSGVHTGTGNAAYNALTGSADHTQSPNRPIDFTDAIGYAPYAAGLGLTGQSPDVFQPPYSFNAATLQSIATSYSAGGAGITTAIALVDDMVRQGRGTVQNVTASATIFTTPADHGYLVFDMLRFDVTGGTTYSGLDPKVMYMVDTTPTTKTFTIRPVVNGTVGSVVNAGSAGSGTTNVGISARDAVRSGSYLFNSIFNLQSSIYTKWESVAASYDASRPAAGLPNLKVEWYEGALEPTAPTKAQCDATGVGIVGGLPTPGDAASAAIAAAIVAWKNDPSSAATIQLYHNTFMGLTAGYVTTSTMPHSVSTSQLVLTGGGVYGLTANLNLQSVGQYQTYYGFAAFSTP